MAARKSVARSLRIATFNVNGIRSRLPHLLQWLAKEQPDIACLQELKAVDEGFPIDAIRDAGYGALWHGQRSWNGVAILARGGDPIESRRGLPGARDDVQSRYLEAAAHGVLVGCLYLPNGNPQPGPKFDYKLAWFDRFLKHAQGLFDSGHPVVLAGDYNVVPTDELDIYDPKHWKKDALLQPESRDRYAALLDQGWTDALRTRFPDEKVFTFWDYFRNHWPRNAGLRIDHLLLSRDLAPKLRGAGVDRWVRDLPSASDHAPTWVELGPKRAAKKQGSEHPSREKGALTPVSAPRKARAVKKARA
ncbi:exodeoxyribonuclease III [Lysobacter sp. A6]|uniref:Exodeoxyribonuclease III n=1 Tax=Noviluteimonas lactosilytica TaxID=2888523 RepID=A0ABS8JEG4_9GAMM|nr:exodeoxyribonuclease III [Lysobacter lactosilyticus]MCC8361873.1 exodeoxyribonuclease III [Lysobacter lactosilyticus]